MFFGSVLNVISAEHRVLQPLVSEKVTYNETEHIPFDVEAEDLDAIVVLPVHGLLPSIELLPFVDVFTACVASPIIARMSGVNIESQTYVRT